MPREIEMHHVLISLASNHEQKENLCKAREALTQILSLPKFTPEQWTHPMGKHFGRFYINQLVSAETTLSSEDLTSRLKDTEKCLGRTPELRRHGIVPIDLDLLLYDDKRFHLQDWERSYIKDLLQLL